MAKKFLTLNIGAANIELAEYELGGKGALTLVNYGTAMLSAPLDGGNAETILTPALFTLVREKGFKPGPIAISLAGQMVFPKIAAIPMAGGSDKFEQMVRYEIEQGIPFPIDDMVCDRQVLGDTENGDKSVMIVAAKLDQVESITTAVQGAGFEPTLVDVAPIALINAVRHAHPEDEGCVVMLDIGARTTSLVIVEGEKVYMRSIPVAGNAVSKEISNALGCTLEEAEGYKVDRGYVSLGGVTEDEDEVADRISKACRAVMTRLNAEISRSINFYRSQQHGSAPTKVYLTGGTALLPQVDAFFTEELGIEVTFFNPFENIAVGSGVDAAALDSDGARISATAGLAVHEAGLAQLAINLMPPSILQAKAQKAKVPFLAVGGLAAVLALVLVALTFGTWTEANNNLKDAISPEVTKLQNKAKEVSTASAKLDQTKAEAEALRDLLMVRGKAVKCMQAVKVSLMPGMWIESWESGRVTVRYWKDRLPLAPGKTASESFANKLKSQPIVDPASVRIANMSAVSTDGSLEQFTVEVKFQ